MNLHQSLFASCRRRRPCWRLRLAAAERTVPVSAVRTGWDGMGRTERRGTKVGKGARRRRRGSRGCSQCMRILDEWTRTQATLDGETRMTAQCEWERVRVCVLTGVSAGVTGRDFGRRSLRSESPIGRVPGTCFPPAASSLVFSAHPPPGSCDFLSCTQHSALRLVPAAGSPMEMGWHLQESAAVRYGMACVACSFCRVSGFWGSQWSSLASLGDGGHSFGFLLGGSDHILHNSTMGTNKQLRLGLKKNCNGAFNGHSTMHLIREATRRVSVSPLGCFWGISLRLQGT